MNKHLIKAYAMLQLAGSHVLPPILGLLGRDLRDHVAHFTNEELESKRGYNLFVIRKACPLTTITESNT